MAKILSADDSLLMRTIIRRVVESLGYDFLEAADGRAALEAIESHHEDIHLVLLDVNMPEMDGFAALKAIKGDERYKNIPVMMVTTESERAQIIRALKIGAVNYVTKPFSHEELSTKIVESLGQAMGV